MVDEVVRVDISRRALFADVLWHGRSESMADVFLCAHIRRFVAVGFRRQRKQESRLRQRLVCLGQAEHLGGLHAGKDVSGDFWRGQSDVFVSHD